MPKAAKNAKKNAKKVTIPAATVKAVTSALADVERNDTVTRGLRVRLGRAIVSRPEGTTISALVRAVREAGAAFDSASATRAVTIYQVLVLWAGYKLPERKGKDMTKAERAEYAALGDIIRNETLFYLHAKDKDRTNAAAFVKDWTANPGNYTRANAPKKDRANAEERPDDVVTVKVTRATAERLAKAAETHGVDVDTVVRGMLDTVADTDGGRKAVAESRPVATEQRNRARLADSGSPLRG